MKIHTAAIWSSIESAKSSDPTDSDLGGPLPFVLSHLEIFAWGRIASPCFESKAPDALLDSLINPIAAVRYVVMTVKVPIVALAC